MVSFYGAKTVAAYLALAHDELSRGNSSGDITSRDGPFSFFRPLLQIALRDLFSVAQVIRSPQGALVFWVVTPLFCLSLSLSAAAIV